jgi:hypothetical protein
MIRDWTTYVNKTKDKAPWKRTLKALTYFNIDNISSKDLAVDYGAGSGRDTQCLLKYPWKIISLDSCIESVECLKERFSDSPTLRIQESSIQEFEFQAHRFAIANAVLPFLGDNCEQITNLICDYIEKGGIFCGDFFGIDHEWNSVGSDIHFFTKGTLKKIFSNFELFEFEESAGTTPNVLGKNVYRHSFSVIALKK